MYYVNYSHTTGFLETGAVRLNLKLLFNSKDKNIITRKTPQTLPKRVNIRLGDDNIWHVITSPLFKAALTSQQGTENHKQHSRYYCTSIRQRMSHGVDVVVTEAVTHNTGNTGFMLFPVEACEVPVAPMCAMMLRYKPTIVCQMLSRRTKNSSHFINI